MTGTGQRQVDRIPETGATSGLYGPKFSAERPVLPNLGVLPKRRTLPFFPNFRGSFWKNPLPLRPVLGSIPPRVLGLCSSVGRAAD